MDSPVVYNKNSPFFAKIKERFSLCHPDSDKLTQHLILDLSNSGISYEVGDSVAIFPQNDKEAVDSILRSLSFSGDEVIQLKSGGEITLRHFLTYKANISEGTRRLIQLLSAEQKDIQKKNELEHLLKAENRHLLKDFLETFPVLKLLELQGKVLLEKEGFSETLLPLLPRFYSIASSPKKTPVELHLTVAFVEYFNQVGLRRGVCTNYLCHLADVKDTLVPLYIQPHRGFTLPKDSSLPIIMVGPGTGVAPFRAFLEEREEMGASGKNWLFFGERTRDKEFLYRDFWGRLEKAGKLRLDLAFSRDQPHKIYVQHRMRERAKDLFGWLQEGAYFFVCGDMTRMAKDVDQTLFHIVKQEGNMSDEEALSYIKSLKKQGRYLRDVY